MQNTEVKQNKKKTSAEKTSQHTNNALTGGSFTERLYFDVHAARNSSYQALLAGPILKFNNLSHLLNTNVSSKEPIYCKCLHQIKYLNN